MGDVIKLGDIDRRSNQMEELWIRRSTETGSKKLAEDIYFKLRTQITEGKFFEIDTKDITFDELRDDLIIDYKVNKKRSTDRLKRSSKHLDKHFGGMLVTEISTEIVKSYILQRQESGAANGQ